MLFQKKHQQEGLHEALKAYAEFLKSGLEKQDWEVDYLEFSRESYDRFYAIIEEYPEVSNMVDWHMTRTPGTWVYAWIDDDGDRRNWDYSQMKDHKKHFDAKQTWQQYKEAAEKMGVEPTFAEIGIFGGGHGWPWEACAYLSFGYMSKSWLSQVLKKIEEIVS